MPATQACHTGKENNLAPCPRRAAGLTRDAQARRLSPHSEPWTGGQAAQCTCISPLLTLSWFYHTASGMFSSHQFNYHGPVPRNSNRQLSRPSLDWATMPCARLTQWASQFLLLPGTRAARTQFLLLSLPLNKLLLRTQGKGSPRLLVEVTLRGPS